MSLTMVNMLGREHAERKKIDDFEAAERRKLAQEYWDGVISEYASLRQEAERYHQEIVGFSEFCLQHGYRKPTIL